MSEEEQCKEWVSRAKEGSGEALFNLWQMYEPLCKRWARQTSLTNWEDEDLMQQSYLILRETVEKYHMEEGMPFGGYYKVRLSIWRNRQLKKKREDSSNIESVERAMANHIDVGNCLETQVEDRLMATFIQTQMGSLKSDERELLRRCLVEGQTLNSLAKDFGMTLEGIKCKKKRSLHKLRKKVALSL